MKASRPAGFTLIEVILSAMIFAMISVITWSALQATFKTERAVNQRTELQETGTALLNKIREDISQAFLVKSPRPITFFKAIDNLDHDRITFSTLTHSTSRPNARESEQTQVTYSTESNPTNPDLYLLQRKETPYLDGTEEVEAETITIAKNLVSFNFEFTTDGIKFVPAWDSKSTEQRDKLPKIAKFSMQLRDSRGRDEFFETTVDIPLSGGIGIAQRSNSSPASGSNPASGAQTTPQRANPNSGRPSS